jgi:hypothetical protein
MRSVEAVDERELHRRDARLRIEHDQALGGDLAAVAAPRQQAHPEPARGERGHHVHVVAGSGAAVHGARLVEPALDHGIVERVFGERQDRPALQVGRAQHLARNAQLRARHPDEVVEAERLGEHAGLGELARDDGHVQAPLAQALDQHAREAHVDAQRQTRIALAQRLHQLGQPRVGHDADDAQAHQAGHRGGIAELHRERGGEVHQLLGETEELVSPGSERRPVVAAVEDLGADVLLQLLHAGRDRGLGGVERPGGAREAAVLDDADEGLELPDVHSNSRSISA